MEPRIIFVGMHNKPGKLPLCGSTKSGKLINRIIERLEPIKTIKTNLCDVEYFPTDSLEIKRMGIEWLRKYEPEKCDVVVLLGAWVHDHFLYEDLKVLKIAHPSSKRSHIEIDEYVETTTEKIIKLIQQQ